VSAKLDRSLLTLVNAAYESNAPTDDWLRDVLTAARPALDHGFGLVGATFRAEEHSLQLTSHLVTAGDVPPELAALLHALPRGDLLDFFPCARSLHAGWAEPRALDSASAAYARKHPGGHFAELPALAHARSLGFNDQLVAKAIDPRGDGCLLLAGVPREISVPDRHARRWSRVMAHLLAALRLRSCLGQSAEAVVEPGGRVVHAEGAARPRSAREALREAAIHIDRLRTHAGARDADAALYRWRALISGRWSLVDSCERDGRRYLVARRNDPRLERPRRLTERQRQIVAYAALGHPNKYIAYVLGLAPSTVATHLAAAMSQLGLRNRAELARVWTIEGSVR
jgi:DNA-binding CsgD family transcriptional regulator